MILLLWGGDINSHLKGPRVVSLLSTGSTNVFLASRLVLCRECIDKKGASELCSLPVSRLDLETAAQYTNMSSSLSCLVVLCHVILSRVVLRVVGVPLRFG